MSVVTMTRLTPLTTPRRCGRRQTSAYSSTRGLVVLTPFWCPPASVCCRVQNVTTTKTKKSRTCHRLDPNSRRPLIVRRVSWELSSLLRRRSAWLSSSLLTAI